MILGAEMMATLDQVQDWAEGGPVPEATAVLNLLAALYVQAQEAGAQGAPPASMPSPEDLPPNARVFKTLEDLKTLGIL